MTEYKCGSAKQCQFGDMCKPKYDIGGCSHYKEKRTQTNEEWLRSATFEELAGAIYEWYSAGYTTGRVGLPLNSITGVVEWLKETHND